MTTPAGPNREEFAVYKDTEPQVRGPYSADEIVAARKSDVDSIVASKGEGWRDFYDGYLAEVVRPQDSVSLVRVVEQPKKIGLGVTSGGAVAPALRSDEIVDLQGLKSLISADYAMLPFCGYSSVLMGLANNLLKRGTIVEVPGGTERRFRLGGDATYKIRVALADYGIRGYRSAQ